MRWSSFIILALLAGAAEGCRVDCQADNRATKEQIARESKAFGRGAGGLCKELAYPQVSLVDDRLWVKGAGAQIEIMKRDSLPEISVAPIEPLEERLKIFRDHFKQVRIADFFDPTVDLTLAGTLSSTRAASILTTNAHVGYIRSHLRVADDVDLTFMWWVASTPADKDGRSLCLEPVPGKGYAVIFQGGTPPVPPEKPPLREATSIEDVTAAVNEACANGPVPCAGVLGITDDGRENIHTIGKILKSALAAKALTEHPPAVVFATNAAIDNVKSWATDRRRPCIDIH